MSIKTKKLANWLDDLMPFNKWFGGIVGTAAEAADGWVFAKSLEYACDKIPEEYHKEVNALIDGIIDKNYDLIKDASTDRLVAIIKSPLGDQRERIVIGGIISIIFELIEGERQNLIAKSESVGGGGPGGDPDKP